MSPPEHHHPSGRRAEYHLEDIPLEEAHERFFNVLELAGASSPT